MANAIAFLDESGDSGAIARGGSPLFVVGLVVFDDHEEASRCDARIDRLRGELGRSEWFEFHFRDNAHEDRLAFLAAVASFRFTCHIAVLEKPAHGRWNTDDLLVAGCIRACQAADLHRAVLVIDGQRGEGRNRRLTTAVRQGVLIACGRDALANVRIQASARSNLLQIADYAAGVVSRDVMGKPGGSAYRRMLQARAGTFWRGSA